MGYMTTENNHDCRQCGAKPGETHRDWDDLARCVSTGSQLIVCAGEFHVYNGREYGEHEGPCGPDVWDGEYPGVKQCREYDMYTDADSFWGITEDLNGLYSYGEWDVNQQKLVMSDDRLRAYKISKGRL